MVLKPLLKELTAAPAETPKRTSTLLQELIVNSAHEHISVGQLLDQLEERAYGFLMFILALPCCLPVPPGFSTAVGLCILVLAAQFTLGNSRPRLPQFIRKRTLSRALLTTVITKILPGLKYFETLFRPRWLWLTSQWRERLIGFLLIFLALALMIPLPLAHFLPGATIAVIALGLIERDGIVVSVGMVMGLSTIIFEPFIVTKMILILKKGLRDASDALPS